MKKKKLLIALAVGVVAVALVGGIGTNVAYEKVGSIMVEQMIETQLTDMILEQAGIDINEVGRVLTEEEVNKLQASTLSIPVQEVEPSDNLANKEEAPTQKDKVKDNETKQDQVKEEKPLTTDDLRVMVKDKVDELSKVVPNADKRAMTQLVMNNLAMSDIQYLAQLVIDGVSTSDLQEAKHIALSSFDQQELEQVKGYYYKYQHLIP